MLKSFILCVWEDRKTTVNLVEQDNLDKFSYHNNIKENCWGNK